MASWSVVGDQRSSRSSRAIGRLLSRFWTMQKHEDWSRERLEWDGRWLASKVMEDDEDRSSKMKIEGQWAWRPRIASEIIEWFRKEARLQSSVSRWGCVEGERSRHERMRGIAAGLTL